MALSRLAAWKITLAKRNVDLARRTKQLAKARKRLQASKPVDHHKNVVLAEAAKARLAATQKAVDEAKAAIKKLRPQSSLNDRAYHIAEGLVGVMEHGGNNQGVEVTKIIRANRGTGPEPWCGDFVAYCYRKAGSKRVTRAWASVAALRWILGISRTYKPKRGDLVRYNFDHVGMFVRDLGNGMIETIEGNTGASGAVSDSSTGGDGVYRKRRSKSLVRDYLHVSG